MPAVLISVAALGLVAISLPRGSRGSTMQTAFSGVVVNEVGSPVPGAKIKIDGATNTRAAFSDDRGRFTIAASFPSTSMALITARKGPVSGSVPIEPARPKDDLQIALRQTEAMASITGLVVDEKGRPINACRITYWEFSGDPSVQPSAQPQPGGDTDSAGRFTVVGLDPEMQYDFSFGGASIGGNLGTTSVGSTRTAGRLPTLRNGVTHDLGTIVVPRADGEISGRVVGLDGWPVPGDLTIEVSGKHTQRTVRTDAGGEFNVDALVDEPLTLRIHTCDDHFCRLGAESVDLLHSQKVRPGGKDLQIRVAWRPPV